MLRHLPCPVRDVEVDRGRRGRVVRVAVEHHQRQPAAAHRDQGVGRHGGGDHPVQRGARRVERVAGRAHALGGRVEHHTEAVVGGDPLGAGVDAGEELGREGGHHQQHGPGAAQAEAAGREVGAVAEVPRGGAHGLHGALGDPSGPLLPEHQGDGRLGHARRARHIPARRRPSRGLPAAARSRSAAAWTCSAAARCRPTARSRPAARTCPAVARTAAPRPLTRPAGSPGTFPGGPARRVGAVRARHHRLRSPRSPYG